MYYLSTVEIRKHLASEELFKAVLEASASLEELFFSQIIREIRISPDLISNWTLGTLLKWVNKQGLIVKKEEYYPILKDFVKLRNMLIHSGEHLLNNLTSKQKHGIEIHIARICVYISMAPVRDEVRDMEKEANIHLEKSVAKDLKFMEKYNK